MRSKIVNIAGKSILIEEKRIKDLKKLVKEFAPQLKEIFDKNIDFKSEDSIEEIFTIIEDKIIILFDNLTNEDLENAYMSEIENLLASFLEVNFTGAKKGISILLKQQ